MFEAPLPTRSFGRSAILALAAHGLFIVALGSEARAHAELTTRVEAPVVVFYKARVPARPQAEPGGGHAARVAVPAPRARRPPPRAVPSVTASIQTETVSHDDAQAERFDDEDGAEADSDEQGEGNGSGSGAGEGEGEGEGEGAGRGPAVPSNARRAWFVTNEWACDRPDHEEEAGRVMVRIRVTVSSAGTASEVEIVAPGPSVFNARAQSCARGAQYLSALDDIGRPIVGVAEFAIQFL